MAFKKLETKKKAEYVVEQILEAIEERSLEEGDKLPSELEIAEMTAVSRPSVREALGALRLIGVVDTKVGDGTYIKNIWNIKGNELQSRVLALLDHGENLFEALEARRIVEPAAAKLALERLDEQKIRRIRKGFDEMQKAAKRRDLESFHVANREFHVSIVEATENSRLASYVEGLLNLFTNSGLGLRLRKQYLTDSTYNLKTLRLHEAILKSLVEGDEMKLQQAYTGHFTLLEEQLLGG